MKLRQSKIPFLKRARVDSTFKWLILDEGSEEGESSSSEEDEDGIYDKPEWDDQFLRLIPKLNQKDPTVIKSKDEFFPEGSSDSEEGNSTHLD